MWQCRILSDITALCYPTCTATSRLQTESFLGKTYLRYQHQPQCIWQLKLRSFECSTLNSHKLNSNCVLKEGQLACKNFDFLKTHKRGCILDAVHFISMVTGHNRFSVIEELSSHAFCKIAAPVSPRRVIRNYQTYPTTPSLPIHTYIYRWHKKTGTFENPNKNWRNPRKKNYGQKLNHYNLPFKRQ